MARAFHRKRKLGAGGHGRRAKGAIEGQLEAGERALLRSLFEQTRLLLESATPPEPATAQAPGPGSAGDAADIDEAAIEAMLASASAALDGPGDDPALQRLLPDAHRDDPLAAAEFRRGRGGGVLRGKLARIDIAIACLDAADDAGRITLEPAQASAFVVALTDVRLVLGQRLGLATEGDVDAVEEELAGAPDDDPRVPLVLAYDFATWLQEGLAQSLLP